MKQNINWFLSKRKEQFSFANEMITKLNNSTNDKADFSVKFNNIVAVDFDQQQFTIELRNGKNRKFILPVLQYTEEDFSVDFRFVRYLLETVIKNSKTKNKHSEMMTLE